MGRPRTRSDDEILRATARVVTDLGPSKLTLAAVAERVGLSSASLVQRFGSKRALLLALVHAESGDVPARWQAKRSSYETPLRALVGTLVSGAGDFADPIAFSNNLAMLHVDLSDPEFYEPALAYAQATRAQIRALLDEAVIYGELEVTDTDRLSRTLEATYNGTLVTWAIHRETKLAPWLRETLEAVLVPWLAVPATSIAGSDR